MQKIDWRTLFEGVGVLAVVLSLIFVGLQIRQDQVLARSELGAGGIDLQVQHKMMAIESDFQDTFVKKINQPNQLTDEEIIEIDFFLSSIQQALVRECYLVERGVFAECDAMVSGLLRAYFENQFAKNWWKQRVDSGRSNPYLPEWVDEEVAKLNPDGNRRRIQQLREPFE